MSFNHITKVDFDRLYNKIETLSNTIQSLENKICKMPSFLPLSLLIKEVGKSRQTVRSYLLNNYEPDVDFKVENGNIMIASNVFVSLKEKYDNKTK